MKVAELTRNTTGGKRMEKPFWQQIGQEEWEKIEVNAKPIGAPFCIIFRVSDIRETPEEQRSEKFRKIITEDTEFPKNADAYISGMGFGHSDFHNSDVNIMPVQAYKIIQ